MSCLKEVANATEDEHHHKTEIAPSQEALLQTQDYGNDDNYDKEPNEDYNSDETNLSQSSSQEGKELDKQQQQHQQ